MHVKGLLFILLPKIFSQSTFNRYWPSPVGACELNGVHGSSGTYLVVALRGTKCSQGLLKDAILLTV